MTSVNRCDLRQTGPAAHPDYLALIDEIVVANDVEIPDHQRQGVMRAVVESLAYLASVTVPSATRVSSVGSWSK